MEQELVQEIGPVDGPVTVIIERHGKKPYPIIFSSLFNAVECATDAKRDPNVKAVLLKANGREYKCYG